MRAQQQTSAGLGRKLRQALALAAVITTAACAAGKESPENQTVAGTLHVCSSCHGLEGRSESPTFPRLAGQQKDYLVAQLKAFRDHTRADPHAHTYMWGMAAKLTDPVIDGVATYFSSQKPAAGEPGDPADMAAGEKIFENGIPDHDVPACNTCHGDKGQGNGTFPRIAGQHKTYLEEQLAAFASNARANEIMHENSKNLTSDQIREVATYLASK